MNPAPVEAHQVANGDSLRATIEFPQAQRRDRERILDRLRRMLALLHEARLDEVRIAPGDAIDQRVVTAGLTMNLH